jgi:hypothetical protein
MGKRFHLFMPILLCATVFSGCVSATGPLYRDINSTGALVPKKGMGLVIIYWGRRGPFSKFHVYANDRLLTAQMTRQAFLTFDAEPGQLKLASTGGSGNNTRDVISATLNPGGIIGAALAATDLKSDRLTLNVQADQTYFVEMYLGFVRENMRQVSKEQAEEKLQDCHCINPPTTGS